MATSDRCRSMAPRLWGLLADELDPTEARTVDRHLATCGGCRAEYARIDALHRLLRSLPAGASTVIPRPVVDRLEILLQELEDGSGPSGTPSIRHRRCARGWTPSGTRR